MPPPLPAAFQEKHVRHKVKANGAHPPDDPFGDSDDNVKELARRFEEKYVSLRGGPEGVVDVRCPVRGFRLDGEVSCYSCRRIMV